VALVALAAGCAAGRAFGRGNAAVQAGEWDVAVEQYRIALQRDPDNAQYRIALVRAMERASLHYLEQGRVAEARGQLDAAVAAYRRANEFAPSNRQLAAKVNELERRLRAAAEGAQPRSNIEQLRAAAQPTGAPVLGRFDEVLPAFQFNDTVRQILTTIGMFAGVNVTFAQGFTEPAVNGYQVQMDGVTLEQALNQVVTANRLFYKVLTPNTILVVNDSQPNRVQYEDQIVKVLHLSNADATEVAQMVQAIVRMPGSNQLAFTVSPNKTQNTITLRAPPNVAAVIERVVEITDKPRAEVVVDVEILEVNRRRVRQYGLDLGDYAIGAVFSPEIDPIGAGTAGAQLNPQPFNLDSATPIGRDDFYLAVPSATIRFLESDSETKILAKPQLRGAEGQELSLELGEEIPVPTTVFTPLAQGGANVNPLSSFNYRPVGVILRMTPRVTYDENIVLALQVENSSRTGDVAIAGTTAPIFSTRRVNATLRLRDGETNMLAGLVQEADRRSLKGIPGILRVPILKQIFSANDTTIEQSDVIVLLTPRIVRSHELSQRDIDALFIGTAANLSLGGASPLIAQPPGAPAGAPAPGAPVIPPAPQPGAPGVPPQGAAPGIPAAPTAAAPPKDAAPAPAAAVPPAGPTGGIIGLSPGQTAVLAGGGQLAVPITVTGASRLSNVTLTVTYNPAVLRVRAVQQGSFMGSAGGPVSFTENHDTPGRIDIVLMRTNDSTGASGPAGTLGVILFDAVTPGAANLNVTGTATAPGGAPLQVQFGMPPGVVVK
jgi:general secretion pathway protein D